MFVTVVSFPFFFYLTAISELGNSEPENIFAHVGQCELVFL